jgi:hypothetical protein
MAKQGTKAIILAIIMIIGSAIAGSILWAEYQRQQAVHIATDAIYSAFQAFPTYAPPTSSPTRFSMPQPTSRPTATPTPTPTIPMIRLSTTHGVLNGGTLYRITLVGSVKDS